MNRHERRQSAKSASPAQDHDTEAAFRQHAAGNLGTAEAMFRQILSRAPTRVDAMRLLAEVLTDQGKTTEAIALLRRAIAAAPRLYQSHYALGNALERHGLTNDAITSYRQAITLEPKFAGAHHGLGAALYKAEREAEAAESFRHAVRLQPDWAVGWKDLGLTLAVVGNLPAAETALQRAISLQPALGDAHRHLAALRQNEPTANEITALRARSRDPRTPEPDRIEMLFALGRIEEKAGRFDAAFDEFSAANTLLRARHASAGRRFDRHKLAQDVDKIINAFSPETFGRYAGYGDPAELPVFIVGMPRAGSTLFEQIAASHPQVFAAGEHRGIGEIARRLGWAPSPAWTSEAILENGSAYLSALSVLSAGKSRVIDKMPDNIFQLGLIATLFPNARVIFCERDARDLAVSIYFQNFSQPYLFDTDLHDIAFRFGELERLKRHWLSALPLRCLTLSYEALVETPEREARRLLGFSRP